MFFLAGMGRSSPKIGRFRWSRGCASTIRPERRTRSSTQEMRFSALCGSIRHNWRATGSDERQDGTRSACGSTRRSFRSIECRNSIEKEVKDAMSDWKFPPDGGHMEKPSKIYYQTMTKKDVEEAPEGERHPAHPVRLDREPRRRAAVRRGRVHRDEDVRDDRAEDRMHRGGATLVRFASLRPPGADGDRSHPDDLTSALVRSIVSGYWNAGFRKQILMSSHGARVHHTIGHPGVGKKYQLPAVIIFLDVMKIMGDALKDKAHGGPSRPPSGTVTRRRTHLSGALPEFVQMENCVDTKTWASCLRGHIDKAATSTTTPSPARATLAAAGGVRGLPGRRDG